MPRVKPPLLSWIELSASALKNNLRVLSRLAGKRHMAVSVKANAYGHGMAEIISLLIEEKSVGYISVHSLEEAAFARALGWPRKIMVLGPIASEMLHSVLELNLEPVVFTQDTVERLGKLAARHKTAVRAHLKLETGTNRLGITEKELPAFAKLFKKYSYLQKPYGASTHFANIEDTTTHEYAQYQIANFERMIKKMAELGIKPTVRHTASSAAMILFNKTRFDLVRPGISVYGHWPSKETFVSYQHAGGGAQSFKPVLSWKTRIGQLKDVPADSFVGYGCTYRTSAPTKLAVLPVGYYDGYPRALSNQSHVLLDGQRAPVRGRVCMNLIMVDVTPIKRAKLYDEICLIGSSGKEYLSAETLAGMAGTINYELLARLNPAMPRITVT